MIETDLYFGYEGEQEIIVTEETSSGSEISKLHLLSFHFDEVLSLIPLGQYDQNTVMYNYFKSEGWHNGKWQCKNIQDFLGQLSGIENIPAKYELAQIELIKICKSALQNRNSLFIELQ